MLQLLTDLLQSSGIANTSGTQFKVTAQSSPNMTVQIAIGHAYLLVSGGSGYPVNSDGIVNVTINANGSGNPRITSIVLYFNVGASANADASNVASIIAVDGTAAASPSAPSTSQIQTAIGSASYPYTVLANILVASGASSIINGNITDTRQAALFSFGSDGWVTLNTTLAYSSSDGHTYIVTSTTDLTGIIQQGDRIKLTNQGVTQYFLVTALTSSTITLYGGTTYTIANSTITNPFYSHDKAPFGFSTNPTIWTEELRVATDQSQGSVSPSTWYNVGSNSLAIPIGLWNVEYECSAAAQSTANGQPAIYVTLSASNTSESDKDFSASYTFQFNANVMTITPIHAYRRKVVSLASKTPYYLNLSAPQAGLSLLALNGNTSPTFIRAISAFI